MLRTPPHRRRGGPSRNTLPAGAISAAIWLASSRVGASTRPRGRFGELRWRVAASGTAKARVLPEPVGASPDTSRPARTSAIVTAWMGSGRVILRLRGPRPTFPVRRGLRSWYRLARAVGSAAARVVGNLTPVLGSHTCNLRNGSAWLLVGRTTLPYASKHQV